MKLETTTEVSDIRDEAVETPATLAPEEQVVIEEMMKAGIMCGRKKSKTNPKMRPYIFATRKGIEIFDLLQTKQCLEVAVRAFHDVYAKKLPVLIVATQPAAKEIARQFAEKFGFTYVTERWLGGTLTNFRVVGKRVERFTQLKADRATGRLEKYTKKERLKIDEEIEKMARVFSGIEKMSRLPELMIVVDVEEHRIAVNEANRVGVPVIGFANSDSNPAGIAHLVPTNDNARASIAWLFGFLEKTLTAAPPPQVQ